MIMCRFVPDKVNKLSKQTSWERIDIFKNEKDERWYVWAHNNGYVNIYTNIDWICKEDVEQFVLERMLDGKI